jgi:hypothetical protein
MLLFSNDTFTVNGITVFPDHADPNQFWYLPGPVGLELMANSTEPQFLLTSYAPDVASSGIQGVGFLNVTLCLTVSSDNLGAITGQIRSQFPNVENPLLSPVSFDDGTVQIVALNAQGSGGAAVAAGPPGTGQAVETILGASNPELFGNNDALFALTLDEAGATILEQAFQDGMTPVGGIYNLKFTGVQPALDVKITADLKRMYTSFSVDFTAQAYWVSAGIDATFEQLRQDGAIQIQVVNLTTDAAGVDRENWALNLFKDQILAQWFSPSLSPTTAQAADAQSVNLPTAKTGTTTPATTGTATQAGRTTSGMGSPTGSSAGAMGSSAASSHPASSMTSPTGASGGGTTVGGSTGASSSGSGMSAAATPASSTTTPAPAAASPAPAAPAAPNPQGGARPATPTTPTPAPAPTSSNPLASLPGTASAASSAASPFGASLRLKYVSQDELKTVEYEFNQMSAVQRTYAPQGYFGLMLQGVDQSKHFLKIDGTDPFFNQFTVTIQPPRDFTSIGLLVAHVALNYGDPTSQAGVKHGDFSFDGTSSSAQTWNVFEGLIQQTQYNYTADYKFDPESGWQGEQTAYTLPTVTTENRQLNLDPYDFLGFLQISVSADRLNASLVDRIEVPLQYQAASGWQASTTIVLRASNTPQVWKLRLADKTVNTYTYGVNCYLKSGALISTPPVSTTATAVIVNDPFVNTIQLTLQPSLNPSVYSLALIEITYQDTPNNYSFQTTAQITAGTTTTSTVSIPIMNGLLTSYQYRLTFVTVANQTQQGSYITATDPLILVAPSS